MIGVAFPILGIIDDAVMHPNGQPNFPQAARPICKRTLNSLRCAALAPMAIGLTRLQRRLLSQVEGYIDVSKEALVGVSFPPVTRLARSAIVALLQQIRIGRLVLVEDTNRQTTFGHEKGDPTTCIHVLNGAFWLRVLLYGDMVSSIIVSRMN